MLASYIKIAWRNLLRYRFHSLINILGLAIGTGFCFLIAAYVWTELRLNSNLRNLSQQYIIQSNWVDPNRGLDLTTVGPLAKALKTQYPQLVANYYRWDGITSTVSKGDQIFREGLQIGDSTLLTMYGFELVDGNAQTALSTPFSVVITEDRAKKYFNKTQVVGESLAIESFSGSKHDFTITGVLKQPTPNSITHVNADNDNQVFIPVSSIDFFGRGIEFWNDPYRVGYVELQAGVKPADVQRAMQQLLKDNSTPEIAAGMRPYLASLKNYYINQNNGLVKKMLTTVSCIALFILMMAIINFINISIGKSSSRIKEIGLRKVMGGLRKQLIQQFLIESLLLVSISTLFAIGIYILAKPYFAEVLDRKLPSILEFPLLFLSVPFALCVFTGMLAGIYPALILSALKAVDAVKGKLQSVNSSIIFRKTLVGFQFFTASIVLIAAIVIGKQVKLFFSDKLGYNKEFVVSIQTPRDWTAKGVQRMKTVRNEFSQMPQVSNVSLSWSVPDGAAAGYTLLYPQAKDASTAVAHETISTDENYLKTFGIPLAAGRYYSSDADSLKLVINETAVRAMGWKTSADAVGQTVMVPGGQPVTVIGVVKDFHFGSMKASIKPLLIAPVSLTKIYRLLCFKLGPGNVSTAVEALRKKWSLLMPGAAFEYRFMDESLKRVYQTEIQLKRASQIATALALIIVVLGIVGLISLSVQKRTREIGIRKILGASISSITGLFLKDFLPVLLVGGFVSIPIAYYIMRGWLNDYSYRVNLTVEPFLISIVFMLLLTTFLIAIQIGKAALGNPVKNLRTE